MAALTLRLQLMMSVTYGESRREVGVQESQKLLDRRIDGMEV